MPVYGKTSFGSAVYTYCSKVNRIVRLPMYGDVTHESPEYDLIWDLFQTEALTRLRDISLSSTPSRFSAHGMPSSRFEHSVGVAYLARKLCDWRPGLREHRDLLMSAAICHDTGSPPFSHISEIFMFDLMKATHEQETANLIKDGTEVGELLKGARVDPDEVVSLINGEHADLGVLIAGSIDLDNIDNSIRLLRSMGYPAGAYDPLSLIRVFRVNNGDIKLDTSHLSQILGWAETRRELYSILHSEPHLSSSVMLYRAIEFAYHDGLIEPEFFRMGESDALFFLAKRCGKDSAALIEEALRWRQYHLCYEERTFEPDPRLVGIHNDWKARKALADEIADRLKIPARQVSIYVGNDRAEKKIGLPFTGEGSEAVSQLFSNRRGKHRFSVFLPKEHRRLKDTKKIADQVKRAINGLPEPDSADSHDFF